MNDQLTQPHRGPAAVRAVLGVIALVVALVLALAWAAPARQARAATDELLVNGGFEDGATGWTRNNTVTLTPTADARTGTGALAVTGRAGTASGPRQDVSQVLTAGSTYQVSAWIRYDTAEAPATKRFLVTAHYGGSSYTNLASGTVTRGQWSQVSGTFTVPADRSTATAALFVETPWTSPPVAANDLMDYVLDDVSLTEVIPVGADGLGKQIGDINPLVSHKFGADPYALSYDGRVYVYSTNDTDNYEPGADGTIPTNTYNVQSLNVWSSADLVNWTDHGVVEAAGPDGIQPFARYSWAPAAIMKTIDGVDTFFLYYANNAGSVNVLTATSPVGPWSDPIGKALINSGTPGASDGQNWLFDPAVVLDEAGNGYLYFGGGAVARDPNNPRSTRVIRLGADMTSTVGSAEVIDAPAVFEASHVFERDGRYYYSYSTNFGAGGQPRLPGYPGYGVIAYLVSDDPMGPWTPAEYAGELLGNMVQFFGVGGNNHHSFFELDGRWFVAYHAQTLNLALVDGDASQVKGYRSAHVDEVFFDSDGAIRPIEASWEGPGQLRALDPYAAAVPAETIAWQRGLDVVPVTARTETPNLVLTGIDTGDFTSLGRVDLGSGATVVGARVQAAGPATITVRTGNPDDGPVAATIEVPATDGWIDVTAPAEGLTGEQDLFFVFDATTEDALQVDSWSFAGQPVLDVTVTAEPRCVAGKVVLAVTTVNGSEVGLDLVTTTATASRTTTVEPGRQVFQTFSTRRATVAAGEVTVTATGTVDGAAVTGAVTAPHTARSCG